MKRHRVPRWFARLVSGLLIAGLAVPCPVYALRPTNAGMEEAPARLELEQILAPAAGLEEAISPADAKGVIEPIKEAYAAGEIPVTEAAHRLSRVGTGLIRWAEVQARESLETKVAVEVTYRGGRIDTLAYPAGDPRILQGQVVQYGGRDYFIVRTGSLGREDDFGFDSDLDFIVFPSNEASVPYAQALQKEMAEILTSAFWNHPLGLTVDRHLTGIYPYHVPPERAPQELLRPEIEVYESAWDMTVMAPSIASQPLRDMAFVSGDEQAFQTLVQLAAPYLYPYRDQDGRQVENPQGHQIIERLLYVIGEETHKALPADAGWLDLKERGLRYLQQYIWVARARAGIRTRSVFSALAELKERGLQEAEQLAAAYEFFLRARNALFLAGVQAGTRTLLPITTPDHTIPAKLQPAVARQMGLGVEDFQSQLRAHMQTIRSVVARELGLAQAGLEEIGEQLVLVQGTLLSQLWDELELDERAQLSEQELLDYREEIDATPISYDRLRALLFEGELQSEREAAQREKWAVARFRIFKDVIAAIRSALTLEEGQTLAAVLGRYVNLVKRENVDGSETLEELFSLVDSDGSGRDVLDVILQAFEIFGISQAGLEEAREALVRQAEEAVRQSGEDPAQSALMGEIRRDIQALDALSASSKIYPSHLQVALQLLESIRDPNDYATGMRFFADLALGDNEEDWTLPVPFATLRDKTLPDIAIGSWRPLPGSDYQTAPLVALPSLYGHFARTAGVPAAGKSQRLVRKGRAHGMINVWTKDPGTLWEDRNAPLRSKAVAELAARLGANHVEIQIPSWEERQALAAHIGAEPWHISLSRLASDYLTEDEAVHQKGWENEDAYRAVTRALMAALYLRVYDFHRYNLSFLKDNDRYRTMWYDSEQGLHPAMERMDPYAVSFLSHFFSVRDRGRMLLFEIKPEHFTAVLAVSEIPEAVAAVEQADLEEMMEEILSTLPEEFRQMFKAEKVLMDDYLPRLQRWQSSFRADADRFFRLVFYYMQNPERFARQRRLLGQSPSSVEILSEADLLEAEGNPTLQAVRRALGTAAGLEQAVPAAPGVRWAVIGPLVARQFAGLEERAGTDKRVLVAQPDPAGTVVQLIELGAGLEEPVYYYGGAEEGRQLVAAAEAALIPVHVPKTAREFLAGLEAVLRRLEMPEGIIAAGLEAIAAQAAALAGEA